MQPRNIEEHIVWYAIRYTWIFYLFGSVYVVGPVVGWGLLALLAWRFIHGETVIISGLTWLWCCGMGIMLLAVIIGHINFDLSTGSLIKSSIGWAKGWALLAIFPLLAALDIRWQLIVRACMHLCQQTLYIIPVLIVAAILQLPDHIYTSPLKFLASHAFFEVELYGISPVDGSPRWRLFTPWAPALGLIGNMLFCLALLEKNKKWRWTGIIACIVMILISQSRMGLLCLLIAPLVTLGLANIYRISILIAIAILTPVAAALYVPAQATLESFTQQVHAARADSSRVRGALGRIAVERWKNEAPLWGHGVVEKGPHYVEYMPIGSHHSWYGLLFVKGIFGLIALAIPMLISLCICTFLCWRPHSQTKIVYAGLHILVLLSFYSLTENLEVLSYLYWPSLLILGMAHNQTIHNKPSCRQDKHTIPSFNPTALAAGRVRYFQSDNPT
ncbi:MAG: O-antigen ligase family protein [Arenicella sp.]